MKNKPVLVIAFIISVAIAKAQTNSSVKLYGYIQSVSAGAMAKGDIDESGRMVKGNDNGAMTNYRLYIAVPKSYRIYPIALWINGKPYMAKSQAVQTPVTVTNHSIPSHPQTTMLIPETTEKVYQLMPLPPIEGKLSAKAKAMAQGNELVVSYKLNGKQYYATLERLTELASAGRQ